MQLHYNLECHTKIVSRYIRVLYRPTAVLMVCAVPSLDVAGSLHNTISELEQLSPDGPRLISLRPVLRLALFSWCII